MDGVGNTWIRFTQLVMLLVIGIRRRKGIWTTHQPWMASSISTMTSTMASTLTNGPSPVLAPGTVYHQALYPQKEYAQQTSTPPNWYAPQPTPQWQYAELAAPQPVIAAAPRELDTMTWQYAPHPMLGPGYLVLQSTAQIQQNYQLQQQQSQSQYNTHQIPQDHQSLPNQHQLQHQPSFNFQQYHTQ
jgi:hypothetical protein